MKKIIAFLICLFAYFVSAAQTYPISSNLGGPTTLVKTPPHGAVQGGIIPYAFDDTLQANSLLQYGKNYNGFLIYTRTPQATWWRLADSSKWIMILPQGGGTPISGQAWINPINNNLFTDASNNGSFGTFGPNGIYFKTNNTTRWYLDRNGIAPETGNSVGIGIDPTDSNRITYFSGGGSTPTWQQTLTAGSVLTQANDITGSFAFSFTDPSSFTINKSGTARLQINTGTSSLRTSGGNAVLLLSSGSANLTGNTSTTLQSGTSEVSIYPDSILIYPSVGVLKIDTLNNETFQNQLMGWTSTSGANRGKVGYITIGSGLSLSSGVLTNTVTAGANTALSNLSSVAINTSLLPGTDDGAALGSTSKEFSDLFLASGGVINWANGNTTLTQTSGSLTLGGAFYATSSVAAGTYLYGGDKYNTYTGYTGAVLGGITTHAVLDFVDNNSRIGEFYTDANNFNFFTDASKGIIFYVNNSFTAPALQFSSAGALRLGYLGAGALTADASGNITSVSDERLKNIEGGYGVGLSQVYKINPIVYKWKPETKLDSLNSYIGFSAQNIEYALGENAVGINRDGYKSIQDRAILAALTNSIKELKDLNDSQQKEIDDLKKEVRKLKRL